MIYFSKSQSGLKARVPKWWGDIMIHYPQPHWRLIDTLYDRFDWFKTFVKSLPKKCPFERQIWYNDTLILFIPALCHFNPFFTQLMSLKLKSLQND